jgi:hypothetical protein
MKRRLEGLHAVMLVGWYVARVYWLPRSRGTLLPLVLVAGVAAASIYWMQLGASHTLQAKTVARTALATPTGHH